MLKKSPNKPSSQNTLTKLAENLKLHGDISNFGDEFLTVFEISNDTNQTEWFIYPFGSVIENITITIYDNNQVNFPSKVFTSGLNQVNQRDLHYGATIHIDKGQSKTNCNGIQ